MANGDVPPTTIWQRLRVRLFGYGPLLPGFRVGAGVRLLSTTSDDALLLASRHPRWSITWLWFVRVSVGRDRFYAPWWRRFRIVLPGRLHKQTSLHLGWIHVSVHWQEAMAYRPGRQGYDRKRWVRYCQRVARRKAGFIAEEAYRAEFARMLEPAPEEEVV